jgi:hypothetical protein
MNQPVGTLGDGCFLTGTLVSVATAVGQQERPVESLQPGEAVQAGAGTLEVRAVEVLPPPPGPGACIQLLPNALGRGRPRTALLVTPEQLLLVQDEHLPEGALVPAGALVNGRNILRTTRPEGVAWIGITLEAHGLLLAAGQPAASRRLADGALSVRLLPPGPGLFALRGRLTRAAASTPAEPPAPEAPTPSPAAARPVFVDSLPRGEAPDLRLVADGALAPAVPHESGPWQFVVPAGATALQLISPIGVPPDRPAGDTDGRRFGVAIQSILLDGIPLDLGGRVAGEGFHALEQREHQSWRWTDGNAQLVLPRCAQPRRLDILINDWHHQLRPEG